MLADETLFEEYCNRISNDVLIVHGQRNWGRCFNECSKWQQYLCDTDNKGFSSYWTSKLRRITYKLFNKVSSMLNLLQVLTHSSITSITCDLNQWLVIIDYNKNWKALSYSRLIPELLIDRSIFLGGKKSHDEWKLNQSTSHYMAPYNVEL